VTRVPLRCAGGCLLLLLLALIGGCARGDLESRLDAYVAELETALPRPAARRPTAPRLEPYPNRGEVRLPVDELRVGLLRFLSLDRRCGIGILVAQRNSAIGMVMPDSQRLVYEQTLLMRLDDCLRRLAAESDAIPSTEELAQLLARKSSEIDRVFWNATFAGPELERLFSLSGAGTLAPEALADSGASSREALDFLSRSYRNLGPQGPTLDGSALELHLQNLALENYGGRLIATAARLVVALEAAAAALEANPRSADCTALGAVHEEQVLAWLQPFIATLVVAAKDFLGRLQRLAELPREGPQGTRLVGASAAFDGYRQRFLSIEPAAGLWQRLDSASARHRGAWSARLRDCGLDSGEG